MVPIVSVDRPGSPCPIEPGQRLARPGNLFKDRGLRMCRNKHRISERGLRPPLMGAGRRRLAGNRPCPPPAAVPGVDPGLRLALQSQTNFRGFPA